MKKIVTQSMIMLATVIAGLSFNANAGTVDTPTGSIPNRPDMLLYIQPYEYTSSIKLTNFFGFGDYWFSQGNMVESLAKEILIQAYGNVAMCDGNQTGKILVWLQPKVNYNQQLNVFYGNVTANAYTGLGKLIGIYVGESTQHGFLDIKPEYWLNKTYNTAIKNMVAKMQADSALQTIVNSQNQLANNVTPCSMVALLPIPKIRTMFF